MMTMPIPIMAINENEIIQLNDHNNPLNTGHARLSATHGAEWLISAALE